MKELSIEEKAKRYDKAIERANSLLSSNQLGNAWIYKLLPELKEESEDERIRKWLIGYFNQYIIDGMPQVFGNGLNVIDVIAWLEKQKDMEAKLIISDEGYSKAFQDGIEEVLTNPHKYGLEKQDEKKNPLMT